MTSIRHNPVSQTSPDDAYLDAAREAILAVGWSRTTLTDIARRAGVSRMTLYRRWPDTQTLLADLMTREWGHVVEMASVEMASVEMASVEMASVEMASVEMASVEKPGAATSEDDAALGRIARGIVETVQSLRGNSLLRRIVDVDPEVLLPYLLERRGRSQEMVADALSAMIAEGQRDGSVRDGDPAVLARSLVLACHGFTLSAHTMSDPTLTHPTHTGASRDADVTQLDAELDELVRRYLQS